MKKKLLVIIGSIVMLYVAVFAVIIVSTILLPAKVYDDQGLLSKNINSANKVNYKLSRQDGITTVTCRKMQGMDTIWENNTDKDTTRQMYYDLDVTSGKAKLILVQPDDTVITLVEQDSTVNENCPASESGAEDHSDETASTAESIATLDLKKGVNRIKIVCGKGTAFSLSFRFSE